MRRLIVGTTLGVVLALLVFTPWAAASAETGPETPGPTKPGDVKQPTYFQLNATQGSFNESKTQLTLSGVDANAGLFTDKPEKAADSAPVSDLIADWTKNGFAASPPNAVLVVVSGQGAGTGSVFTLANPQLSGDTLTFSVQPTTVKGKSQVSPSVQQAAATASGPAPSSFGQTTLFVDPVNDFMHYCFVRIRNATSANLVSAGVLLISPRYFPAGILKKGESTVGASLGPLVCNINYGFTGGGYNFGLTMVNPKGSDNIVKCGATAGRCQVRVTHDTATFNVEIELIP